MLKSIIDPILNPYLLKLYAKNDIFDQSPNIIWIGALLIGFIACLFLGFKMNLLGILFLLAFFILHKITLLKKELPIYELSQFTIFTLIIFLVGINQPLASGFIIFTVAVLFMTESIHKNLAIKNPDFAKERSFYHPTKLIESYEILLFIILVSFFNEAFAAITALFAIACWAAISTKIYDLFKDMNN